MKAIYEKWYDCKPGQMPENFDNVQITKGRKCVSQALLIWTSFDDNQLDVDYRECSAQTNEWKWHSCLNEYIVAWKLTKPYKKR